MDKLKFRSRCSGSTGGTTEPGRKFKNEYEISIDDQGHKSLTKTGETNAYSLIQQYEYETRIDVILERAAQGDLTALNRHEAQYIDCTDMPVTLAEAQNKIIQITNEFNSLPLEERKKFDMSPEKYIKEYGSKEWGEKLGLVKEVIETPNLEIKEEEANE